MSFVSRMFFSKAATDTTEEVTLKTVKALSHTMMTVDVGSLPEGTVFKPHENTVDMPKSASPKPVNSHTAKALRRAKSIGKTHDVQLYGVLEKKVDKRNRPTRFVKRFFVLKEAFLLYFPVVSQSKVRKWNTNMHPKGVISLANTNILPCELEHKCGIRIEARGEEESKGKGIVIVCETELQRHKWMEGLQRASQITCANAALNATIISELEESGMRLHSEKQEYVERLQREADTLCKQIDRNHELEQLKGELEVERHVLEETSGELRGDLDNIRRDLTIMALTKQTLEQEKSSLNAKTKHLCSRMEKLETDKVQTESRLAIVDEERRQYKQQNSTLNAMSGQFKSRLDDIERQQAQLMSEKRNVEKALRENTAKTGKVEQERDFYHKQADALKKALDDLNHQRDSTMKELHEEHCARELAERQLSAAERALSHLEMAMRLSGKHMHELREQIMPDVCSLRELFEEMADAASLNAKSGHIMKEAVGARAMFLTKNKTRLRNSIRQAKRTQRRLSKMGGGSDDDTRTTTSEEGVDK